MGGEQKCLDGWIHIFISCYITAVIGVQDSFYRNQQEDMNFNEI